MTRPLFILAVLLALSYVLAGLIPPRYDAKSGFDFSGCGRIPVSHNGRVKPIETVARVNLMILSQRHALRHEGERISALQWMLDVVTDAEVSQKYQVFRIDHPDVKNLMGFDPERKKFSYDELLPHASTLMEQHRLASAIKSKDRNDYQRAVLDVARKIMVYNRMAALEEPFVVAPIEGVKEWMELGPAMRDSIHSGAAHPSVRAFGVLLGAYQKGDASAFNEQVRAYLALLQQQKPHEVSMAFKETLFQRAEPFYRTSILYVIVFLGMCGSWLMWAKPLNSAASGVLVAAFLVHTLGLVARMWLEGRPPVTNLYSSAIFVGWGCVLLALIIEWVCRSGAGTVVAAATGFLTLVVAHNLDGGGDTMEMMRAVLDSNFWLATHVVVITLGYSTTFLAGFLGILYIFRGLLTRSLPPHEARNLARAVYGIICFATLMSFTGTVLGGIWADQSWGRFWGWDPKENGALIIVLWNAVVLHARWGGMIQQRGVAVLSVFGNVVTAWSWFGVNMLSIGLHSYGFIDSAVFWLLLFVASQLLIMAAGCVPLHLWRSGPASRAINSTDVSKAQSSVLPA